MTRLGLANARSVNRKGTSVVEHIDSLHLDMLVITESWLTVGTGDQVIRESCPEGFDAVHRPRLTTGGGIALIYKNTIDVQRVEDTQAVSFESLHLLISTRLNGPRLRLLLIYRPPNTSTSIFMEEFGSLISEVITLREKLVVLGDFNIHVGKNPDRPGELFLDLIMSLGLVQLVQDPTRKSRLIDLLLTRERDGIVTNVTVSQRLSDHDAVQCNLSVPNPHRPFKTVTFRSIKTIDIDAFSADLLDLPLLRHPASTLDELVDQYDSGIRSVIDKHAPLRTKRIVLRQPAPWLTGAIRAARCELRHAERTWKATRLTIHEQIFEYKMERRNYLLERAKASYFNTKVQDCGSDQRSLYKIVNSLSGKSLIKALPKHSNPRELATVFAEFFRDKIANSRMELDAAAASLPEIGPPDEWDECFLSRHTESDRLSCFEALSTEAVKRIILSSPSTSCCLDPLPTSLLKTILPTLLTPLTSIVNLSLLSGRFPSAWKHALISPLLKKPSLDPNVLAHYRPISFLPFVSKLIERATALQLNEHLSTYTVLSPYQSAYRAGHSIETLLLSVTNDLLLAADEGDASAILFLDLSAAFDTIDHDILLDRLERHCGITANALEWFSSYLKGRSHSVSVDGTQSSRTELIWGVAQGSVLGAILYIIYVNPHAAIDRHRQTDCMCLCHSRLVSSKPSENQRFQDRAAFRLVIFPSLETCPGPAPCWRRQS